MTYLISIRLDARTRHFLESLASALGSSIEATSAMLLAGSRERSACDARRAWPTTAAARFVYLMQLHGLSAPDIVDLMQPFGFQLSTLVDLGRLTSLLTYRAMCHVAEVFAVELDWLAAGVPNVTSRRPWTEADLNRQLAMDQSTGLCPSLTLVRARGGQREHRLQLPLLAAVRRAHHTPTGTPFATLQVRPFDRGPGRICTPALLADVAAACHALQVPLRGVELPYETLRAVALGSELAVQGLSCIVPEIWHPAAEVCPSRGSQDESL